VPTAELDRQILEAGRRALARFGWARATLERIADEAGLSRVTLHRRGVTKDAILTALVDEGVTAYRAALWPALTGSGSGRTRLEEALNALCSVAESQLPLLLALRAQSDAVFHDDRDEALTRTAFTDPVERLLRDGAADGSLAPVEDVEEAATVLFNMVGWTYFHLRTAHRWRPDRARRAVVEMSLAGVLARDGAPA
jgi:AcrR family transcriptional regulator